MKKSDLYYSKTINNFHTNILTELGTELYNKSIKTKDTMLLDIREVKHDNQLITFQTIDRSMFGIDAPDTYEIDITDIPVKSSLIKRLFKKS